MRKLIIITAFIGLCLSGFGQENKILMFNGKIIVFNGKIISVPENKTPLLPANPLAYWPFKTNALDSSGNGYNGTVTGATLTTDKNGTSNYAYQFTEPGIDYISYTPINLGTTHTLLIRLYQTAATCRILEGNGFNDYLATNSGTQIVYRVYDGATGYSVTFNITSPLLNNYRDLVITRSGTTVKCYINGVQEGGDQTLSVNQPMSLTTHGGAIFSASNYQGKIDGVAYYDRVLTTDEMTNFFLQLSAYQEPIPSYNNYATALFSNFALQPDINRKSNISQAYDSLEYYNIIDSLDFLYVFNAFDVQASLVPWIGTKNITPINHPTFVLDSFWYGGVSMALNTNFIPSIDATKMTGTSASMHFYKFQAGNLNRVILGVNTTAGNNRITAQTDQSDNSDQYYINNNFLSIASPTSDTGLYSVIYRNDSVKIYIDNSINGQASGKTTHNLADRDIYALAYNLDETVTSVSTAEIGMIAIGHSLSNFQLQKLNDIYFQYKNAIQPLSGIHVNLYCFNGQSNMTGFSSDSLQNPYPSVEIYDSASNKFQWIHGAYGGFQRQPVVGPTFLNPILATARYFSDSVQKGFFCGYAYGGTRLAQDVGLDWNPNSTGEYFDNYLAMADSAINRLSERGYSVDTLFDITFQGEADAATQSYANAWQTNKEQFITDFNSHFASYQKKHILIQITNGYTYSDTVNHGMVNIAAARTDTDVILNTAFTYRDGVHLTDSSYVKAGELIYNLIK